MPGADDKVILRIKLETTSVSKELQGIAKEIQKLSTAMGALTKSGTTGFTSQNNAIKAGTQALKEQERLAKESVKRKTTSNRDETKQYEVEKKRNRDNLNNIKETEGILRRFGRGLGIGSGMSQRFARPEGGYAQRAGQLLGSAPRVMANTAMSIGSGLLGFLLGGIQGGYGTYLQVGQAMAPLAGMGGGRGARAGLQPAIGKGVGMGYTPSQTYQHAAMVGRLTGDIRAVTTAQQFGLAAGGMDVGEASGIMGALRGGGLKFGLGHVPRGKEEAAEEILIRNRSNEELRKLIAAGMATGIEKTRLNQYMQNVAAAVGVAGTRTLGNVDLQNIKLAYGLMSKIGLTDPQRARAAAEQLDQAIRAPGGGEAGQALVMGAFGFGAPGGKTSYYEALRRQEQGFMGEGGAKNALDVFRMNLKQYAPMAREGMEGNAPELRGANLIAAKGLGLGSIRFAEGMNEKILAGTNEQELLKMIEEELKKQEPIDKQALAATKEGFKDVAIRLAAIEARNAGIGASAAKLVESVQDIQYKLLRKLVDMIPTLIEYARHTMLHLKVLVEGFKAAGPNPLSWGKAFSKASKDVWEAEDKRRAEVARKDVAKEKERLREIKPTKTFGDYLKEEDKRVEFLKKRAGADLPTSAGIYGAAARKLYGQQAGTEDPEAKARRKEKLAKALEESMGLVKAKKKGKFKIEDMPLTDPAAQEALLRYEDADPDDPNALSAAVSAVSKAYSAQAKRGGRRGGRKAPAKRPVDPIQRLVEQAAKGGGILGMLNPAGAGAFAPIDLRPVVEESRSKPVVFHGGGGAGISDAVSRALEGLVK